jgi:chromosome segregation ATPase
MRELLAEARQHQESVRAEKMEAEGVAKETQRKLQDLKARKQRVDRERVAKEKEERRLRTELENQVDVTDEWDSKIDRLQVRISTHETEYDQAGEERARAEAELRGVNEERESLKKQIEGMIEQLAGGDEANEAEQERLLNAFIEADRVLHAKKRILGDLQRRIGVSRNEARDKSQAADDSAAKARECSSSAEKRCRTECRNAKVVEDLLRGEKGNWMEYRASHAVDPMTIAEEYERLRKSVESGGKFTKSFDSFLARSMGRSRRAESAPTASGE